MSLPAYLFLYDENGMQIIGDCLALGREGAIEIMNSSYVVLQCRPVAAMRQRTRCILYSI